MVQELVIAKVESALQASQLSALAGKTVTVSKVSAATSMATFSPVGAGPESAVMVKLDAARQVTELKALVGKTVLVGKPPMVMGGMGNWVALHPVAGSNVATVGAAAKTQLVMLKVEGAQAFAQLPALTGKTVTVMQPMMVGGKATNMLLLKPAAGSGLGQGLIALKVPNAMSQGAFMAGKTFTVAPGPVIGGNICKFLVLKPAVASVGVVKAVAVAGGASAGTAKVATMAVQKTSAASTATTAAGTIWTGKGLSLGLGLGLGAWGPALVLGLVGAGAAYGYLHLRKNRDVETDEEIELREALIA